MVLLSAEYWSASSKCRRACSGQRPRPAQVVRIVIAGRSRVAAVVGARPRRRTRVLRVRSSRRALRSSTGMLRALVHAAPSDRERTRREPNSGFLKRSDHRSAAAIRRCVAAGEFAGAA